MKEEKDIKSQLIYECQRLDLEYAMLQSLKGQLVDVGKEYAAEDLNAALDHLMRAIAFVKKSWKFLDDSSSEQLRFKP